MDFFTLDSFDEWEEVAENCEYATFFHTPHWYRLFADTYPYMKIHTQKLTFTDGKSAILPLMEISGTRFRKKFISGPAGVYGGSISTDTLSQQQVNDIFHFIKNKIRTISLRLNPFTTLPSTKPFNQTQMTPDSTQVIDLSPGFKKVVKKWTKGHYSAAMQGKRKGVTVRQAEREKDWKAYYDCYADSIRRWGNNASSQYEWDFFLNLFKLKWQHETSAESQNVKLWVAEKDDTIISGCLCFYNNRHIVYWHGASLEAYFQMRPVHWLQYQIIQDAVDNGFRWYDFNPSGGHDGVVKFKNPSARKKWKALS